MDDTRKGIGIFIITAIVAICAFVALSATASAAVINVPSAGNVTIQEAINNASDGDTILVNATAYAGTIEIVDVTQSNIIIRSVNGRAVVSAGGASDHVFNITDQTNVTLEGFTIRDAHGTTKDVAGIYMYNATECNISNTIVTNISATEPHSAYGIHLNGSSNNNRFSASTFVSNVTAWYAAYGIHLNGSSNNNTFSSSTSVSNVMAWYAAYGISLYESSNNNTFNSSTSVSNVTAGHAAYGISLYASSNNNRFSSSTSISNVTAWYAAYGISLYESSNNTFSSSTSVSTVTSTGESGAAYGIYLCSSSNYNTFNSSTSVSTISAQWQTYGIYLEDSSNNTFSASTTVSNVTASNRNAVGILLGGSSNNNTFSSNTSVSDITATTWNAEGIYLDSSNNNTFSSSTSVSNVTANRFAWGILLFSSNNNTFNSSTSVSNVTANQTAYGICFKKDSDDNTFTGVTITPTINGSEYYEFYSEADCDGNVVTDMTLGNPTTISFTYGNGIWIKRVNVSDRATDPQNFRDIGKYINASNVTVNSWLFVNFSYNESDVAFVDETTLSVWEHNGTAWNEEGWNGSRVLDTANNVVGVNITSFSIFAPLGNPTSVTIPTATGTGDATITTSSGYFCDVAALKLDLSSLPDSALTFTHGFFNFTICGLNDANPENVTINFTFPSAIPTDAEFWKYNVSNGTWYRYPFGDNDGDNVISITINDNGPGDHNPALGIIEDPNGIGWRPPAVAPVPAVTPLGLIALVSLLSTIAVLTMRRKRR